MQLQRQTHFHLRGNAMELEESREPGTDKPGLRINSKGSRYSRDSSGSWDDVSAESSNVSSPSLSSPKRKKQFFKSCTATRDFDTIELHPTSGRIIRVLTNCLNSTWLDVFSGAVQDSVAAHSEQTLSLSLPLSLSIYLRTSICVYIYIVI